MTMRRFKKNLLIGGAVISATVILCLFDQHKPREDAYIAIAALYWFLFIYGPVVVTYQVKNGSKINLFAVFSIFYIEDW